TAWIATRATAQTVTTLAQVLNLPAFYPNGRPNIPVTVFFDGSGLTAQVIVFAISKKPGGELYIKDHSNPITFTAPSATLGGAYSSASYTFDSMGGEQLRIALYSLSGGNAAVGVGSFGQ